MRFLTARRLAVVLILAASPTIALAQLDDPIPESIGPSPFSPKLKPIATGLSSPIRTTVANDGSNRLFVVDQVGEVRLVKNGQLRDKPFLDVSDRLVDLRTSFDERGLLGLTFHPGFDDPTSPGYRKLYTYTSEPFDPNANPADFTFPNAQNNDPDHQSVVTEWQVSSSNPDMVDPTSRREVMRIDQPQFNHNAGTIEFGPDGYLHIALGDGGAANDVAFGHTEDLGNGQDTSNIFGSMVRIDPVNPSLTSDDNPVSANGQYRIPADNPFVGDDGNVDEIFAHGLRNPFSFSFDSETGDLLLGDAGQNNIEEIDLITKGGNFGWNEQEGSFNFDPETGEVSIDNTADSFIDPILEYDHDEGSVVIGGFVYRGSALPELFGRYIFGDFGLAGTGRLFEANLETGLIREMDVGLEAGQFIKGFGQDENGEIFVAIGGVGPFDGGGVYQLVPEPSSILMVTLGGLTLLGAGWRARRRRAD